MWDAGLAMAIPKRTSASFRTRLRATAATCRRSVFATKGNDGRGFGKAVQGATRIRTRATRGSRRCAAPMIRSISTTMGKLGDLQAARGLTKGDSDEVEGLPRRIPLLRRSADPDGARGDDEGSEPEGGFRSHSARKVSADRWLAGTDLPHLGAAEGEASASSALPGRG